MTHARVRRTLAAAAATLLLAAVPSQAQDFLLVSCDGESCTFRSAYQPIILGSDSVRLVPASTAAGAVSTAKSRSAKINSLPGLYREPSSGVVRVLDVGGDLGPVVVPSKLPRDTTDPAAPWPIDVREHQRAKTRVAVPGDQFVALIRVTQRLDRTAVDFVRRETKMSAPHPRQAQLLKGALTIAAQSDDLRQWRDELSQTMRASLEAFRRETADPAQLEATLAAGVEAIRIFKLVTPGAPDDAVQRDLIATLRTLRDRFAIAEVLKNARLHDAFLEKTKQIGLAKWSRPRLLTDLSELIETSAQAHYARALELSEAKQFARAFEEAEIASLRSPCNDDMSAAFSNMRTSLVIANAVASRREPDNANRTFVEQIVRGLQGVGELRSPTPEQIDYYRKRIAEGERLDRDYIPLQLRKAEFLANIGELSEARAVVSRVERTVALGRIEADEWLKLDADLTRGLVTLRQRHERLAGEQIASGDFKQVLETAAIGLAADPDNPRLLYQSAVAAAVLRNYDASREFVRRYLRRTAADCGNAQQIALLLELYRSEPPRARAGAVGDVAPNWISGEMYPAGEASYDTISGSFNPRVGIAYIVDGKNKGTSTAFTWEGFLALSIRTAIAVAYTSDRQTQLEVEPVYEQNGVYMSGIGSKAASDSQRRVSRLRYLNSPDFDPLLAAKFTGKMSTTGWAGNPFFHPFLWSDIYLFDLEYDNLGRLSVAKPVRPDASRPVSPLSEPLTFNWDGNSKRLLSITGSRYRRVMEYNNRGLLVGERITHPLGKGKISYVYKGKPARLVEVLCEDDFYDRTSRRVSIVSALR